jgi:6-phosphogluconolactonase
MNSTHQPGDRRDTVTVFNSLQQLVPAAADLFVRASQAAAARGVFRVALAGGSTPRPVYQLLASSPFREQIAWSQIQVYWGDERNVGPDSDESNYKMAREALLDHVPVGPERIHRIRGEVIASEAAMDYQQVLARTFGLPAKPAWGPPDEWPRFDLILLGMGPDGHTASLFPNTTALEVRDRTVVSNPVPKLDAERITLTVPVLNAAASVVFLVAGADKADALAAVLEGPPQPMLYPSQLVAPANGELRWLVDESAAARLTPSA